MNKTVLLFKVCLKFMTSWRLMCTKIIEQCVLKYKSGVLFLQWFHQNNVPFSNNVHLGVIVRLEVLSYSSKVFFPTSLRIFFLSLSIRFSLSHVNINLFIIVSPICRWSDLCCVPSKKIWGGVTSLRCDYRAVNEWHLKATMQFSIRWENGWQLYTW